MLAHEQSERQTNLKRRKEQKRKSIVSVTLRLRRGVPKNKNMDECKVMEGKNIIINALETFFNW